MLLIFLHWPGIHTAVQMFLKNSYLWYISKIRTYTWHFHCKQTNRNWEHILETVIKIKKVNTQNQFLELIGTLRELPSNVPTLTSGNVPSISVTCSRSYTVSPFGNLGTLNPVLLKGQLSYSRAPLTQSTGIACDGSLSATIFIASPEGGEHV